MKNSSMTFLFWSLLILSFDSFSRVNQHSRANHNLDFQKRQDYSNWYQKSQYNNKNKETGLNLDTKCTNKTTLMGFGKCDFKHSYAKLRLQLLCEGIDQLNGSYFYSNKIIKWSYLGQKATLRSDAEGYIKIGFIVNKKSKQLNLKSESFNRNLNFHEGPYKILLSQKECSKI